MNIKIKYNEKIFHLLIGIGSTIIGLCLGIPFNMIVLNESLGDLILQYLFIGIIILVICIFYLKLKKSKQKEVKK